MDKYNRKASEDGTFDWDIQDSKIDVNSVKAVLKEVFDPEIHINIHDLGLIYHCDVVDGKCDTVMTLTSPFCPVAGEMPGWVEDAINGTGGVRQVSVDLTWEPPWGMDMMSDEERL